MKALVRIRDERELLMDLMPRIEGTLDRHLPVSPVAGTEALNEAIRYTVMGGGKRMRPVLCLLGARLAGIEASDALPVAAAVEYLHTASLILDDLPCMDAATERRGQPPVHREVGEGVALLAALALLNQSYALFGAAPSGPSLVTFATGCIGHRGMIAGQVVDVGGPATVRAAGREAHYLKTTALVRLAIVAGALGGGGRDRDLAALDAFGSALGTAYQLLDDWVDQRAGDPSVQGTPEAGELLDRALVFLEGHFGPREEVMVLRSFGQNLVATARRPSLTA